jgi:hypothetical protein
MQAACMQVASTPYHHLTGLLGHLSHRHHHLLHLVNAGGLHLQLHRLPLLLQIVSWSFFCSAWSPFWVSLAVSDPSDFSPYLQGMTLLKTLVSVVGGGPWKNLQPLNLK